MGFGKKRPEVVIMDGKEVIKANGKPVEIEVPVETADEYKIMTIS